MATSFSNFQNVPIRPNAGVITAAWWNALRLAGMQVESNLQAVNGDNIYYLNPNVTSPSVISGLSAAGADGNAISAILDYDIYVLYSGNPVELHEVGRMICTKKTSTNWTMTQVYSAGDDPGVVLSIDTSGNILYTSLDYPGTVVQYRIRTKIQNFGV